MKVNPEKSKYYIECTHMGARWDEFRGDIPNGTLSDASGALIMTDGAPLFGLTTCNVPIGTTPFVKGYLKERQEKIVKEFDKIALFLEPGR